ncbi:MAG: type III pantothenate kinase [Thiolinea sp.]
MSSLLIDAGNSRLEMGAAGSGSPSTTAGTGLCRTGTGGGRPATPACSLLQAHPQVRRVVLVHVLGEDFTQDVQALCEAGDCELVLARSVTSLHGLQIAYPNPAHLGADRFVGLLAARQLAWGRPLS